MTLVERIKIDFVNAYREKNFAKKNSLSLVKAEIDLIEKQRACTDDDVMSIITKLLKWINETLLVKDIPELIIERELYSSYMPQLLTRDEVKTILESQYTKPYNMWDVMKYFKVNYGRRVDNNLLSSLIRE